MFCLRRLLGWSSSFWFGGGARGLILRSKVSISIWFHFNSIQFLSILELRSGWFRTRCDRQWLDWLLRICWWFSGSFASWSSLEMRPSRLNAKSRFRSKIKIACVRPRTKIVRESGIRTRRFQWEFRFVTFAGLTRDTGPDKLLESVPFVVEEVLRKTSSNKERRWKSALNQFMTRIILFSIKTVRSELKISSLRISL